MKLELVKEAFECLKLSPRERKGYYIFSLQPCFKADSDSTSDKVLCVEVPYILDDDSSSSNVLNKLLDIESQAFSRSMHEADYSFHDSERSKTIARVEQAMCESQLKANRPIDMEIIEKIKALR